MEPQPGSKIEPTPPSTPAPQKGGGNYDFIMNPEAPKKGLSLAFIKDPFIAKIILVIGGAMMLMIAAWVAVTLLAGGKTNTEVYVGLAQREQEIMRISELGEDSSTQQIKSAAINTKLSMTTHQNSTLTHLKKYGREVSTAELAAKQDSTVDTELNAAQSSGTFDSVYTKITREQLTTYAQELKSAYDGESSDVQKKALQQHYSQVALLLEQWPKQ